MKATGIPPHISILCQMKDLQTRAIETVNTIESNRIKVVQDIILELEERAIGAKTVTFDGLNDMIESCLERSGITSLVDHIRSNRSHDNQICNNEVGQSANESGKYRRLPDTFSFSDCGPRHLYMLWVFGNKNEGWPPFRLIQSKDLKTKDQKKRLCDVRFLMRRIDRKAKTLNINITDIMDIETVMSTFERCKEAIAVAENTEHQRKRRTSQLSWRTFVNLLRKHR